MDHSEHFSSPTPEHIQLILTDTSFWEASWTHFPQKKGSSLETPVSERGHKALQLCSHLVWAMVYTSSHLSAPMTLWQAVYFWCVSDIFHLSFPAFQKLHCRISLLACLITASPLTCQSTYFLVWAHFITLGQSENWDTTSPMHLLALPSWGSFMSDITTSHV